MGGVNGNPDPTRLCIAGTNPSHHPISAGWRSGGGGVQGRVLAQHRPLQFAQAAGRQMLKQKSGSIINIASIFGHRVAKNASSYCASKAAVLHLTRALSLELARHDIRVNALSPGLFDTEMTHHMFGDHGFAESMVGRTPCRRAGEFSDLDGALLLLASDASRFMNGSVIVVDGGILNGSL